MGILTVSLYWTNGRNIEHYHNIEYYQNGILNVIKILNAIIMGILTLINYTMQTGHKINWN